MTTSEIFRGPGHCFRNALTEAGVQIPSDLDIPQWVSIEKVADICQVLDLRWAGPGAHVDHDPEPVIVLYQNIQMSNKTAHAVFVQDAGALLEFNILGIIFLDPESGAEISASKKVDCKI